MRSGVSHTSGMLTTCPAVRLFGIAYMSDGALALPAAGVARRRTHQLSDQNGIGLVVAEVIEVSGASAVVERDEISAGIQTSAYLEGERRSLGIPSRLFVPHPLHANRPADFLREKRRLEARIIGGRATVAPAALPSTRRAPDRAGSRETAATPLRMP